MKVAPRIALGGIITECNHLGGPAIDLQAFQRYELRYGEQVLEIRAGAVRGMLQVIRQGGAQPAPLLFASACPGGLITSACYHHLRDELLHRLSEQLPVDGVLLPLHGAMAAEGVLDVDGDLIRAVRALVGLGVPIVATLDLHAQVTRAMVTAADALVAWETYPHRDAETTGRRGGQLLLDHLAGKCQPFMAMAKVPVITGAYHASTDGDGPFARLMRRAKSFEGQSTVLSTSLFLGQPYLDVPEMGSGALVVTDRDQETAVELATALAQAYWEMRHELEPETLTPEQAIRAGLQIDGGPIVLVEAADCCGGGAAGDSIATLRALLAQARPEPALVPVVDSRVAAICQQLQVGQQITTMLGHHHDPSWGQPLEITGTIQHLSDGRFLYDGGIWDKVEGNMGPSAVLSIGSVQVLVTSHPTYDWRDEQFRSVGLNARRAKFVVAKNPMNFHQAYGAMARAVFVLDTPGPTPITVQGVSYSRMSRPYFPADSEIPDLRPTILSSAPAND